MKPEGGAINRLRWLDIHFAPSIRPCIFLSLVVVQYVETGEGEEELMAGLESEKYTQEILRAMFSGMHTVLTAALRQPGLKAEVRSKCSLYLLLFIIISPLTDF